MVIVIHELGEIIRQLFSDADIKINDLAGDDSHYYLKITSKHFLEKTKIEQYRIAYNALEGQSIHALQLETST